MAYLRGKVRFASQTLTASTTYNVFCGTAPTNQKIAIEGFGWFGAANAAQTPGILSFCRAASAGSAGTTLTPLPLDDQNTETFQSTWLSLPGTAPTSIAPIDERLINPQVGAEVYLLAVPYIMRGAGFFVVQFTPGWTGNYDGFLLINE